MRDGKGAHSAKVKVGTLDGRSFGQGGVHKMAYHLARAGGQGKR